MMNLLNVNKNVHTNTIAHTRWTCGSVAVHVFAYASILKDGQPIYHSSNLFHISKLSGGQKSEKK